MRSAVKTEGNSSVKLVPYLKDFPFDYYCIVSDTSELPNALGTILVQWFSMVSAAGGPR
jgi:midasin (ATPase involved in ribosome maturation)